MEAALVAFRRIIVPYRNIFLSNGYKDITTPIIEQLVSRSSENAEGNLMYQGHYRKETDCTEVVAALAIIEGAKALAAAAFQAKNPE